jgi:phosphotriesterase-related protein
MVNTVLGSISADMMGPTMVHEHCFMDSDTEFWVKPEQIPKNLTHLYHAPVTVANLDLVKRAAAYSVDNGDNGSISERLAELEAYKAVGGITVIDVTPEGLGRNNHVHKLPQVSKDSGVNIVAAAGHYVAASHPPRIKNQTAEQVAQDLIKEITEGILDTGIKAGVIKTAVTPNEFTDADKKVIKAAAIAHRETGVPITTHIWGDLPGKWPGMDVIDLLRKNDADLDKFYISHIEWTENQEKGWGVAIRAAKEGVYLSIDNFGKEFPYGSMDNTFDDYGYIGAPTDLDRVRLIKKLIDEGYEDRIVVGHDSAYKVQKLAYGGPGLCHILNNVPTIFKHLGIDQRYFEYIVVDNPRKLFG